MTAFPLLRVVGARNVDFPAGVVFNAPRPLLGADVSYASTLMGFTVVVEPDHYRPDEAVDFNLRMDARVVEWVSAADALAEARAYVADEYDAATADDADDDVLMDVWQNRFRLGTREVNL